MMKFKKTLIAFMVDQLPLTAFYFINSFCLFLFYYLTVGKDSEWVYPLIISSSIWICLMVFQWSRYYPFFHTMEKKSEDTYHHIRATTNEQKVTGYVIENIQNYYRKRISELKNDYKTQKEFLTQWIHNIKTPVTVIDLILAKCENEPLEYNKDLMSIREESRKLHHELQNVLQMLRFNDFSKDYIPEKTELLTTIKKIILDKRNQFIYSNIIPEIQCKEKEVIVFTDAKWNKYIIEQIISNAIKYSDVQNEKKKIIITIRGDAKRIHLCIEDQGIGIPSHDLGRVFEPFFTGDNGRTHRNATGMGLYLCSVIAHRLGHELFIDSELRKGTKVNIYYQK